MAFTRYILAGLFATSVAGPAYAQFWDQGMNEGVARSDFDSPLRGTIELPITYGLCVWPEMIQKFECEGPVYWPQSNWLVTGDSPDPSRYWVIHANNNSVGFLLGDVGGAGLIAPPGQTRSIGVPGEPGHGFHLTHIIEPSDPLDDGWHIIVNTDFIPTSERPSWAPPGVGLNHHLALGAVQGRGNGPTPPATLNGPETIILEDLSEIIFGAHQYLRFEAQQVVSANGTVDDGASFRMSGFYVMAEWGGEYAPGLPRTQGLFVLLHEDASDHPNVQGSFLPDGFVGHQQGNSASKWNWPIEQSFFYPGVSWAFVRVDHLATVCPSAVLGSAELLTPNRTLGNMTQYKFHLTRMFACLQATHNLWAAPYPTHQELPVTGIFWFQEASNTDFEKPSAQMWLHVDEAHVTTQ